jgi:hypothetical protein
MGDDADRLRRASAFSATAELESSAPQFKRGACEPQAARLATLAIVARPQPSPLEWPSDAKRLGIALARV